jgi:hypothetical protein
MRISSVVLVALLTLYRTAAAQQTCDGGATCLLNVSATASINSVARLSISTTTTTLTTPATADFGTTAGVNSTGPTITVKANTGYTLTASAVSGSWTGGSNTKPATDLKMKVNGGALTALGQVAQTATATGGTSYAIGYNTIYNWAVDTPGSYSLVVKYTLTAP